MGGNEINIHGIGAFSVDSLKINFPFSYKLLRNILKLRNFSFKNNNNFVEIGNI